MGAERGCRAIQYSDMMQCAACDLAWDVNDPAPPACKAYIRADMAEPDSERTSLSFAPGKQPTLAQYAAMFYDVKPYQRKLLDMVEGQLRNGHKIGR